MLLLKYDTIEVRIYRKTTNASERSLLLYTGFAQSLRKLRNVHTFYYTKQSPILNFSEMCLEVLKKHRLLLLSFRALFLQFSF